MPTRPDDVYIRLYRVRGSMYAYINIEHIYYLHVDRYMITINMNIIIYHIIAMRASVRCAMRLAIPSYLQATISRLCTYYSRTSHHHIYIT